MRGSLDFSFSLLLAVLIGLAVLVLGTQMFGALTPQSPASGNTAAYLSLKTLCASWREALDQCPDCSCDTCRDQFVNEWMKYYHIPYWVNLTRLSSSAFCQNCPKTTSCEAAVAKLAGTGSTAEILAKFGNALKHDKQAAYLRNEIAPPCAEVCVWVVARGQQCSLGAANCAKTRLLAPLP